MRVPALTVLTLAVTAVVLAGCVESGRPQAGGERIAKCPWGADPSVKLAVNIGWQRIPNGDLIVKDKGLLETCMPNANITWTDFDSGAKVIQAYASGNIDLALIGNSPSVTAMSPDIELDVQVVWIHDVIGAAESLVTNDPRAKQLSDLKGKTIGVPFGSTAHYSLLQAIGDAGLDPNKDFKIVSLEPDAMAAAWKSGGIQAAWVWDPAQSRLLEDGGRRILSSADTAKAGFPTYDLGTADGEFVAANPEFMRQWAAAQDYAVKQISANPEEAVESIAATLAVSAAAAKKQLRGYTYLTAAEQTSAAYLGGQLRKDLINTASFLLDQGSIAGTLAPEQYDQQINPNPARGVNK